MFPMHKGDGWGHTLKRRLWEASYPEKEKALWEGYILFNTYLTAGFMCMKEKEYVSLNGECRMDDINKGYFLLSRMKSLSQATSEESLLRPYHISVT